MHRLVLIGCAALLAVACWAAWFLWDANRLKPALADTIERETGIPVEIKGSLEWQFIPRLWLAADDLYAVHSGRTWSLERLVLRPDIASLIRNPVALDHWRLEGLALRNLVVADAHHRLRASRLTLRNIGPDNPAALEAEITYTPRARPPIEVSLAGTFAVATDRVRVRNLAFRTPNASGVCNVVAMPNGKPSPPEQRQENAAFPLAIMRTYDWDGRCDFEQVGHAGETIENAYVVFDNKEGGSIVMAHAPAFLGGEAQLEVVVQAAPAATTWQFRPRLSGVNSRALANLLGVNSPVAAALDYQANVRMTGNTPTALLASINAQSRFSTGPGELDSAWLAKPLSEIAGFIRRSDGRPGFPNSLQYQRLDGSWNVEGTAHRADLTLDNLEISVRGDYWIAEDRIDAQAELRFGSGGEHAAFEVGPPLAGMPFRFRCQGAGSDPACELDVADALLGVFGTAADTIVQEYFPEEQQDSARSLLNEWIQALGSDVGTLSGMTSWSSALDELIQALGSDADQPSGAKD